MEKKETKRRERREKEELLLAVDEQGREARERVKERSLASGRKEE